MAKSNGTENGGGFNIPVTSLAKKEATDSQAAFLKQVTKEHGDTDPLALEKRRCLLTEQMIGMKGHLKKLQMDKKLFMVRSAKEIKDFQDNSPETPEKKQQLAAMQMM